MHKHSRCIRNMTLDCSVTSWHQYKNALTFAHFILKLSHVRQKHKISQLTWFPFAYVHFYVHMCVYVRNLWKMRRKIEEKQIAVFERIFSYIVDSYSALKNWQLLLFVIKNCWVFMSNEFPMNLCMNANINLHTHKRVFVLLLG